MEIENTPNKIEDSYNFYHPYLTILQKQIDKTLKSHTKIILSVPDMKFFTYSLIINDALSSATTIDKENNYFKGQILNFEDIFIRYSKSINDLHLCKFKNKVDRTLTSEQLSVFSPILNSNKLSEYSAVFNKLEKLKSLENNKAKTFKKKILILDGITNLDTSLNNIKINNQKVKSRIRIKCIENLKEQIQYKENTIYYTQDLNIDFAKSKPDVLYILSHKLLNNQLSFLNAYHEVNTIIFCDCFDFKKIKDLEEYGYKVIKFDFNQFNEFSEKSNLLKKLSYLDAVQQRISEKILKNETFSYDKVLAESEIFDNNTQYKELEKLINKQLNDIYSQNNSILSFKNLPNHYSNHSIVKKYFEYAYKVSEDVSEWILEIFERKNINFNDVIFLDFKDTFVYGILDDYKNELERFLNYIESKVTIEYQILCFLKIIISKYSYYEIYSKEKELDIIIDIVRKSLIKTNYEISYSYMNHVKTRVDSSFTFINYESDYLLELISKLKKIKESIEDSDFDQVVKVIFRKFIYRLLFELPLTSELNYLEVSKEIDAFITNTIENDFYFLSNSTMKSIKDFFEDLETYFLIISQDHNVYHYYNKIIAEHSISFEKIGVFTNHKKVDIKPLKVNSMNVKLNEYDNLYDLIIVFFPSKNKLKRIIMSNMSKKIIIVNYPFCIARQKRYLKNVYKYNKLQNLDYLDIGENPEISLNLKSDFSFNHFQSHYLRPDEAFGRVLIFKNNKSIFLRENSTVFCYHNNNIIEKKCYELDKNDICMIVNNEKESVNQVLSTMLKQENVENLKQYCTVWKKALRDYLEVNSLFDLKQDLEEKGVKLCINTLKNWINKDNILGPKKYSHFIAIKEITNNLELINQYKEIWEAISFLRGKSIIAGKNNMKLILSNIRNKKIDIKLNEEKNINGIGNVNFYEFDFFYSKCSLKNCYLDKIMDLNDLIKILKEV